MSGYESTETASRVNYLTYGVEKEAPGSYFLLPRDTQLYRLPFSVFIIRAIFFLLLLLSGATAGSRALQQKPQQPHQMR